MTLPIRLDWFRLAAPLLVAAALPMHAATAATASSDADFMKKAAQSGQMEIEASKLAVTKASDATVKNFAAQMVKDHTAVDGELKRLASQKGVELPGSPPNDDQKKLEALGALSGPTFDRQYAEEVGVKAHNEAVTLFRNASKSAKDADIKAFAAKTLPALEHHLEMARKMAAQVPK